MARTETEQDPRHRPPGRLRQRLAKETRSLVLQEIALAKAELGEKGRKAGAAAGVLGAAAIVGLLAAGALTTSFILLLDRFLQAWLAALVVALGYAAIAAVLYVQGRKKLDEASRRVAEQAAESVEEDRPLQ